MISELGRRLASEFEPTFRDGVDRADARRPQPGVDGASGAATGTTPRSMSSDGDEDPDFAVSLSSASLRLADGHAETPADATAEFFAPATSPEPARAGPASRAIDAYREIARAPLGERIRIVV